MVASLQNSFQSCLTSAPARWTFPPCLLLVCQFWKEVWQLLSKLPNLRACQVNLSTLSPFDLPVLKGGLATLVKTAKPPRLPGEPFHPVSFWFGSFERRFGNFCQNCQTSVPARWTFHLFHLQICRWRVRGCSQSPLALPGKLRLVFHIQPSRWLLAGGDGPWRLPDPKWDQGCQRRDGDLQWRRPLWASAPIHSWAVDSRWPSPAHCWPVRLSTLWAWTKVLLLLFWN